MDLKNKKIVIATHVFTNGPAQDLLLYLDKAQTQQTLFIGHPLFFDEKLKGAGFEIHEGGKITKENYPNIKRFNEILSYFGCIFKNIIWTIQNGKKFDLYIGANNLNAFAGIILKRMGKVQKTVYYTIDYNPHRFNNKILNNIFHFLDRFCVKHCDETWNLSARMQEARKEYFGFDGGKQFVVPVGTWFDRIQRKDFDEIQKHTLVFMGHLIAKQGVQYVLQAIPQIIKEIGDFKFVIVGGGNYETQLKKLTTELAIDKYVEFTGITSHEKLEKILSGCALAVAMYDKYDENGNLTFTYFADPSKIKVYFATGLPVLLSDVSHNAQMIQDRQMGRIIDNNPDTIAQNVIELMKDENTLSKYRNNAIEFARNNSRDRIFDENMNRILNDL